MRIAILSDVHGNDVALEAVLADAHAQGVDRYWLIGDFAAIGPQPAEVLARISKLPAAHFARGNTDRYVVTGEGPPPQLDTVRADTSLVPLYAAIRSSFAWTRGYVTAAGWFEWLERLPLEIRHTCPDGVRVLAVHAAPGTDDGEGVHPGRSNESIRALMHGADADLVLVGHTHEAMIRSFDGIVVANVGSVSNPHGPDRRACYLLLESSAAHTRIRHRRVAYDRDAFAEAVHRSRHPSSDYILSFQRGERAGRAPHADHEERDPDEAVDVAAAAVARRRERGQI